MSVYRMGLFLVLFYMAFFSGFSQTISEWRGIGRTGIYAETGLLKEWPEEGPEKVWSVGELGEGYSSPAMGEEYIYVTGRMDTVEYLTAIDYEGNQVWQVPFGLAWNEAYPNTRTTPTVHNDKVYLISGMGEVACHDAQTGKQIWYRNAFEEFSGNCNMYGVAEAPLIFEDKVFFTPGGDETSMIALDKNTGDLIWKTESLGDSTAYVSPLYVNHNGRDLILNLMGDTFFGVDPADGTILWHYNYLKLPSGTPNPHMKRTNCNTPVYSEGDVFITKGYNHPAAMFSLNEEGTEVTLKWTDELMDTHHGGVVLIDGYLYASNWINNSKGNWCCINWETGEDQWEVEMNTKGSIISADGMLYCYDERRGQLVLVNPDTTKMDIVSSFRIREGSGPHWAHPVIYQGILYIRHGEVLIAYYL